MEFIIALLLFSSTVSENQPQESLSSEQNQTTELTKESAFIIMERSPCFGKCPNYKIIIFNTGKVIYEGFTFVEKEGKYESQLTTSQLNEIKKLMEITDVFNLQDKYDSHITDIPSCILIINDGKRKKKIYDRDGAPKSLKEFEKLIDFHVLNSEMTKIDEPE